MRELAPQSAGGGYVRPSYTFTHLIGDPSFPAEPGRYHLYVGNPCPWCHRVLLALAVLGLAPAISFSWLVDDPERASRGGWVFEGRDPVFGCRDLREVYSLLSPGYSGRCTAPLLVDKKERRVVCNESALILRSLARLDGWPGATGVELRPQELAAEVDAWNERLYEGMNNAVYRSGFATSQAAYEEAQRQLWATLDEVEAQLSQQRFLCGPRFTEADLRLFPTIVRSALYATLFKCCRRRVADYPALAAWMRDVHSLEVGGSSLQVCDCFDLEDARRSYFSQLFPLSPGGIVPTGPTALDIGLGQPAGRGSSRMEDAFHLRPSATAAAAAVG
eukprot:scaffold6.g2660.t1